jgi:hypothetical protein
MKTYDDIINWCRGRRLKTVTTSEGFAEERRRRFLNLPKPEPAVMLPEGKELLMWAKARARIMRESLQWEAA